VTGTDEPGGPRRGVPDRPRRGRTIAYHLTPAAAWTAATAAVLATSWPAASAAADGEPFRPASLETEGFVHLTHRMADLVDVANLFYRDEPGPHVVLTVVLGRLGAPWRYDGDARFPHVYGPLDRAAIVEVRTMERGATGTFVGPGRSSSPRH
jgi:uncharacterized protein (DUF952 family)